MSKENEKIITTQTRNRYLRAVFNEYFYGLSGREQALFKFTMTKPYLPYMDSEDQLYAFIRWLTGKDDITINIELRKLMAGGVAPLEGLLALALKYSEARIESKNKTVLL